MNHTFRARVIGGSLQPLEGAEFPEGAEVLLAVIGSAATGDDAPFLGSAGSWRGLVDSESLTRDIYADRW